MSEKEPLAPAPETSSSVIPIDIVEEMKTSYLDYSMSVIVSRALPDVRDGLKPVHRRIFYSLHGLGLYHTAKFRKSALVVGDVLGKYHPHGDSACYDALARLAQDFSMRYPLVLGQGNFGSIDGDAPAAMRYTEAKMAPLAAELLRDIEKETVDFMPNYDSTREEPRVLPSAIPNLLLNGTLGIAVGMATKIPPHNLREVMAAIVHLIDEPEAGPEDLLRFVTGPDFPTGGLVFNQADLREAYATGRGGVVVRGEAEIVENGKNSEIVISSVPYQVNKAELIVRTADLVREKKIEGIKDIRDESTTLGNLRVVIELKGTAHPQKVLNYLYKHTDLEIVFHYNMLALVDGVPRLLPLKSLLAEFIAFRRGVVTRRARFDLREAEAREHILIGLKKALDHIDAIIKTIKASADVAEARANLIKKFEFSERQAEAILEMRLQKLAGLERQKIEDELAEKQRLIKELKDLLASEKKILAVVRAEAQRIGEQYGDDRRTKVVPTGVGEIKAEDLVPERENVLVLTRGGYLKRTDPGEYRAQRRGGVGVVDLDTKEEDFVTIFAVANTHSDILFFSDRGKVYKIKMYEIPEGKRATRGKSIMNFLPLVEGERITSVLPLPKAARDRGALSLVMVTRRGVVKKLKAHSFEDVRRNGLVAIKLEGKDELLSVLPVEKGDQIVLATREAQSLRFRESDLRPMGRPAMGVRATRLRGSDEVISADRVPAALIGPKAEVHYLVMSANGFGKRTALREYKVQKRGGVGIRTASLTPKTGKLIGARIVGAEDKELFVITKHGQVIRVALAEISILGRATQGVRVMKPRSGDSLASFTLL